MIDCHKTRKGQAAGGELEQSLTLDQEIGHLLSGVGRLLPDLPPKKQACGVDKRVQLGS